MQPTDKIVALQRAHALSKQISHAPTPGVRPTLLDKLMRIQSPPTKSSRGR